MGCAPIRGTYKENSKLKEGIFKIYVKTLTGKTTSFTVNDKDTVKDIKLKI